MSKLSETTKAYFAGFFDGEGYVGISKSSSKDFNLRVVLAQKKTEILFKAKEIWGGNVYIQKNSNCGVWDIKGNLAEIFLRDIQQFVFVKKAQIEVGLDFRDFTSIERYKREKSIGHFEKQKEYNEKIKALNSPMGFGKIKIIKSNK
jgi:hypothetical protein